MVTYYCYNPKCPVRTSKEPWPRSDGEIKNTKIISKKGNMYYAKRMICKHCGGIMHKTRDLSDFE